MNLSRRELLTTFLGAPIALAACRETPERFPDGEIVGQSVGVGHVIREGRNFEVPADAWRNVKVVIVGGGVAGLSAAWLAISVTLRKKLEDSKASPQREVNLSGVTVGGLPASGSQAPSIRLWESLKRKRRLRE